MTPLACTSVIRIVHLSHVKNTGAGSEMARRPLVCVVEGGGLRGLRPSRNQVPVSCQALCWVVGAGPHLQSRSGCSKAPSWWQLPVSALAWPPGGEASSTQTRSSPPLASLLTPFL